MRACKAQRVRLLVDVAARRSRGETNAEISKALGISERSVYRVQEDIRKGRFPELDEVAKAVVAQYHDARLETTKARMLSRLADLTMLEAEKSFGIFRRINRRRRAV